MLISSSGGAAAAATATRGRKKEKPHFAQGFISKMPHMGECTRKLARAVNTLVVVVVLPL